MTGAAWLRLANQTAVVTGSSSGIGAAVTNALIAQGVKVFMADVSSSDMMVVNIGDPRQTHHHHQQQPVECNVTSEASVQELFRVAHDATILVNCAGITRDGWISKLTLADYQQVLDVNLTGTWLTCRAFVQLPTARSIINLSSVVALHGNKGQSNYAASKGGVIGLTKALAKEVALKQIRVNAICPGFIDTPMANMVPKAVLQQIKTNIPLGNRLGTPEEVADLVLFLASDRSGYITGEAIECSGMISL
jgi:3-oxoacyl-[acyl-carrier protein] reductase